jgi:hypothetical protein
MSLSSSEVTVDEANGRILNHESRYNCTLIAVMTMHTPLNSGDSNVFKGRDECLAYEDAGEEPDKVFRVLDYVGLVWNRVLNFYNEPVVP